MLILKRNPDAKYSESYNVLFERTVCRSHLQGRSPCAPLEAPWFWGLEFHEWQGSDGPQYAPAAIFEASPIYQVLPSTKIKSSSEC